MKKLQFFSFVELNKPDIIVNTETWLTKEMFDSEFFFHQSLVRPQLEYASTVWSRHTATDITKLEAMQRRSARWATYDYQRTYSVT